MKSKELAIILLASYISTASAQLLIKNSSQSVLVTITQEGLVGIGTTSNPAAKLHVYNQDPINTISMRISNGASYFNSSSADGIVDPMPQGTVNVRGEYQTFNIPTWNNQTMHRSTALYVENPKTNVADGEGAFAVYGSARIPNNSNGTHWGAALAGFAFDADGAPLLTAGKIGEASTTNGVWQFRGVVGLIDPGQIAIAVGTTGIEASGIYGSVASNTSSGYPNAWSGYFKNGPVLITMPFVNRSPLRIPDLPLADTSTAPLESGDLYCRNVTINGTTFRVVCVQP